MKKKTFGIILAFLMCYTVTVKANSFSTYDVITACGFDYLPSKLPNFTSGLYNILKILVPVILIIMGMLDLTRAMMASDEDKMKKAQKNLITRLIAGVCIFFIMAVVQFVFNQISINSYKEGFSGCINCLLNNQECGSVRSLYKNTCDGFNESECSGTDSSGAVCETVSVNNVNKCRSDCSSIKLKTNCISKPYCKWTGSSSSGKCVDIPKGGYSSDGSGSSSGSSQGEQIVAYAKQFVGQKYVYGGTWNGEIPYTPTDCSGFTQGVYKHFGYTIPRTASTQSIYSSGQKITDFGADYSNLKPGDLLFYKNDSSIGHVTIYAGDGTVVHASSAKTGVKTSNASYKSAAWAVRIID